MSSSQIPMNVRQRLAEMSLEAKVGQLFMIGFDGQALDAPLRQMIREYGVGGVIFFARNVSSPEQVAELNRSLQAAAREAGHPGLIIAVDQEGGRVARLTEDTGFTEFPGAMAISASGSLDNARRVAAAMAVEMRAVGFNADFAPDLDVNNNPENPVIGLRSFSSDPQRVADYGAAFIQGLQSNGVMAFGKHFPGHGDDNVDSHIRLPVLAHTRERLAAVEFVPFQAAMQAGVDGIMSAHVAFLAIEPDGLPGTLSPRVMTGLIRDEMQYQGLLTTDSLEMGALGESGYPVPQAAAQAFTAGADLLLFNRDHELHRQAYERVLEKLRSGEVPLARLDAAVERILLAKARYGLLDPAQVTAAASSLNLEEHHRLSRAVAQSALTLVRCAPGLLPLQAEAALVVEVPSAAGLAQRLNAQALAVHDAPTQDEIDALLRLSSADGRPIVITTSDAKTNPAQVALVNAALRQKNALIVIAVRNPYDLMAFPEVKTYLAAYGSNPPMLNALADLLLGRAQPAGSLPVNLPGLYALGAGLRAFPQ